MMDKKTTTKVATFRKDLNNLAAFLEDKKPLDERLIDYGRSWLLEIEHMMRGVAEQTEDSKTAQSINQALDLLPDTNTAPREWSPQLYKAANSL
jgi:hypothetical protein